MGVLSREGKVDQRQHSYCSLFNCTSEGFKPSSLSCLRITRPHSTDAGMSFPLKPRVLLAFPSALKYPRRSHSSLAVPLLECLGVPPVMSVLLFLLPASSCSPYPFVVDNNLFRSRTHERQKSAGLCMVSSVRD